MHENARKMLIHFHMFKNGGSTLDWILKKNFGSLFFEFHGPVATSTQRVSDCLTFLHDHPHAKALSSHHLRFPIDTTREDILPLLILRHPVDRVISVFEHERRQPGIKRSDAKFASLSNWLRSTIANEPYSVCDTQTVFVADGGTYYEPPNSIALVRAMETLNCLPFCGVVNLYAESMVVLEDIVRQWNPGFDAAYFPQNVSIGRHVLLTHRLEAIEKELDQELFDYLWLNNAYDIELFKAATSKLFARLHAIDDWETKLNDLKSRCDALR
jgi:hypothetical protein